MPNQASDNLTGLANHLHDQKVMALPALLQAIDESKRQGIPFTAYLVKNNFLSSAAILQICIKTFELPVFNLAHYDFNWLHQSGIKPDLLERYHVIPLNKQDHYLYLAMTDPTDHAAMEAISFHTGLKILPRLIAEDQFAEWAQNHCQSNWLTSRLELT